MTVRDLITAAAILDGIIESGQTLNPEELATGFLCLNDMVDEWNTDRLNIYSVGSKQYQLSNKGLYQIGPAAADFPDPSRPILIQTATVIVPGTGKRIPMGILDSVAFAGRSTSATDAYPDELYCDYAWPIANLSVTPVPTANPKIELYTWSALAQFATPDDVIVFPPGYRKSLRYNLGVQMASEFEVPLRPDIAAIAQESKGNMRSLNAQFIAAAFTAQQAGRNPEIGVPQPMPERPPQVIPQAA